MEKLEAASMSGLAHHAPASWSAPALWRFRVLRMPSADAKAPEGWRTPRPGRANERSVDCPAPFGFRPSDFLRPSVFGFRISPSPPASAMIPFLYQCTTCGKLYQRDEVRYLCPACAKH